MARSKKLSESQDQSYTDLVRLVFNSEHGVKLLKELHFRYCGRVFDKDPLEMARRAAQRDLIEELKQDLQIDESRETITLASKIDLD